MSSPLGPISAILKPLASTIATIFGFLAASVIVAVRSCTIARSAVSYATLLSALTTTSALFCASGGKARIPAAITLGAESPTVRLFGSGGRGGASPVLLIPKTCCDTSAVAVVATVGISRISEADIWMDLAEIVKSPGLVRTTGSMDIPAAVSIRGPSVWRIILPTAS